jgi:hypothetical protein
MANKRQILPRSYRFPREVVDAINSLTESTGLSDTEIVKRAVRYFSRRASEDRGIVVCDDASKPFDLTL